MGEAHRLHHGLELEHHVRLIHAIKQLVRVVIIAVVSIQLTVKSALGLIMEFREDLTPIVRRVFVLLLVVLIIVHVVIFITMIRAMERLGQRELNAQHRYVHFMDLVV